MAFPDEEAKLSPGRITREEKLEILQQLGEIAQEKYDEYIVQGGMTKGYNLTKLKGSLKFEPDVEAFENEYYLEGEDEQWTKIANYFEYGTGLYNQRRAGKYRAGYIRANVADFMRFKTKDGKWVVTDKVRGVQPIFAMEKAIKYVQFNRKKLQREIRLGLQND